MSNRTVNLTDALYEYLTIHGLREPAVLKELRQETARIPQAMCQIAPEEGQFLAFLIKLINAKNTLELGVFTGYSALCAALALPPDGTVMACDISSEWTAIAKRYWQKAGVAHKITLRLAPAMETLNQLIREKRQDTFDFVFIDADKENYEHYYEKCMELVRPGGLIMLDNMFMHGAVVAPNKDDRGARTIDALNHVIHNDSRVEMSLLPLADGVTLVRKK